MSFASLLTRLRYPEKAKTLSLYRHMKTMSEAEISDFQFQRLHKLFSHFYETMPFYRKTCEDCGISPEQITGLEDLLRLPVMNKEILRTNEEEIKARAGKAVRRSTSGSTGVNFHFYLDRSSKSAHNAFADLYHERLGIRRGLTVGIWGGNLKKPEDRSFLQTIKLWLLKTELLPGYGMDEARACEYLRYIQRKKPTFVYGYPSYLAFLARSGKAAQLPPPKGFVLVASGEQMTELDRVVIEEYFQTKVYNRYGSCEFSTIAHELPDEKDFYVCPAEFLLETNENDELLVTDLWNFATPFIRYNIGDRASLVCENGVCRIKELYGRCNDVLFTPSGKMIPSQFWTILSRMCEEVEAFQTVQLSATNLVMRVKSKTEFDPTPILENFNKNFGDEMQLLVTREEAFETTKMGKHKFVIRKETV